MADERRHQPPPQQQSPQTQRTSYMVSPRPAYHARRRRKDDNPILLPWWSLLLMLLFVIAISFGIIALVFAIGGNIAPTRSEPRIVIVTPNAANIPSFGDSLLPSATVPPPFVNNNPNVSQSFTLAGPTLEPVPLTPTEIPITIGSTVVVTNVGPEGQNIRAGANIFDEVIFVAPEGTTFLVIDGPRAGTGLTWWQVQDVNNPSRIGWAASIFLVVQST
ncbi:MAG: SH3 domain-containing protein [Chloroflexi bacterium]|nr:MAG: hypothetical protein CUN54_07020 [Phototrophicales bacterium]RMF78674.1 MAG: SH3 domain-containing protein [Chloroflexota bacterium]